MEIPVASTRICGVIPPIITPLTPEGNIDHDALAAVVEHLLAGGVDGVFVLGSTGEVAYLDDSERESVVRTVVDKVAGRVPVLVGAIDTTAGRVIHHARRAQSLGADAIVATAPLYAINDSDEIERHFRAISAASTLPLFAYDIPARVHTKLPIELLTRLGTEGVLAGVKDSSGDDVNFRRLVAANVRAGRPLMVLTGHEVVVDGMLLLGADGVVPGLGNVDPVGYVRLLETAQAGDWTRARQEQDRLAQLFEIVYQADGRSGDAAGVGAFKVAMKHLGVIPTATMAFPVEELGEAAIARICAIVDAALPVSA
ncbi:dihydrodipicolinate synthase family protein [Pseudactinotalea sp. Z1732]|uniref:dihydrodipicolinate synthase family protein n=1 Tax=Micrococcales TaxID=85006 RepID=UPI003C7C2911